MKANMTDTQIRDYTYILNYHLLPYFTHRPFSEFTPVLMKKFLAKLNGKKIGPKRTLSAKRIQNLMIPLRVITKDAFTEYGWSNVADPFFGLKLPKVPKTRVLPFSFREWNIPYDSSCPG
jgi:hypothetical protein